MSAIELIVGLGNPGRDYADTRHNAGAWLVEELARQYQCTLSAESRFHGLTGRIHAAGQDLRLLIPTTFMNRSGQAVSALAKFFKIPVEAILVVHDELDIPPGTARYKKGGGHGGHNGLRDIIKAQGNNKDFHRLRIGIGHPGHADQVVNYVLHKPGKRERECIDAAIDEALRTLPDAISGHWSQAMTRLHSFKEE